MGGVLTIEWALQLNFLNIYKKKRLLLYPNHRKTNDTA